MGSYGNWMVYDEMTGSGMTTHICMPVLYMHVLLMLKISYGKSRPVIYYDIFPRYLRGLMWLVRVSSSDAASFLSSITGMTFEKIQDGDQFPDYPHSNLKAMETTADIALQIVNEVNGTLRTALLEKLIGTEASMAYVTRCLTRYHFFHRILPIIILNESTDSSISYTVTLDPSWPSEWHEIIKGNLNRRKIEFVEWPDWYVRIRSLITKTSLLIRIPFITMKWVSSRGVRLYIRRKGHFKLASEFVDPRRFNGTAYDADYWVDGVNIDKKDVLFFLTNRQKAYLRRDGSELEDIRRLFRKMDYKLVVLDDLPYCVSDLFYLALLYFELIRYVIRSDDFFLCGVLSRAWDDYLEFLPLFLHFKLDEVIYLTLPNGQTGIRFNDAIVTGLCRKHGVISCGCQTRSVYSKNFEYCFECYDIYFSWGIAWDLTTTAKLVFIKRVVIVGCIYLDSLLPVFRKRFQTVREKKKDALTISVFPTDFGPKHHYTRYYTISFLIECTKLAALFPNYKFLLKAKDPLYSKKIREEKAFCEAYSKVRSNFAFADNRIRNDYADILASSDVVLAIAFTTPGVEALLLGKTAIYYSELKCGGQAFQHLPDLVANNADEFKRMFCKVTENRNEYSGVDLNGLNKLDPFRDGQALGRITRVLMEDEKRSHHRRS